MMQYYYINAQGQQCGPVSPSDFAALGVDRNTMVWCNGMATWAPAGTVAELAEFVNQIPPRMDGACYNNVQQTLVKPDSYLVWAILTTVLCCLPFGIVAIVYASKVDGLWSGGRYQEAEDASRKAKTWSITAAVSSVVFVLIYLAIVFLGIVAAGI
ncbi:MAG: CD225/dispanin family protein [Bacteroidales bacterium]|nr:CD225/dispanin family protein [Bacteroidales bacterium]